MYFYSFLSSHWLAANEKLHQISPVLIIVIAPVALDASKISVVVRPPVRHPMTVALIKSAWTNNVKMHRAMIVWLLDAPSFKCVSITCANDCNAMRVPHARAVCVAWKDGAFKKYRVAVLAIQVRRATSIEICADCRPPIAPMCNAYLQRHSWLNNQSPMKGSCVTQIVPNALA